MSKPIKSVGLNDQMVFETLSVRKEGAVLFVEISAPPMNLLDLNSFAIWFC